MNNKELQAARKLLMLDVSEAAEHVGNVSARSWQYWEAGRVPVPGDVAEQMQMLLRMRRDMIAQVFEDAPAAQLTLRYFNSLAEFLTAHPEGNTVGWRLHQSVSAHYYCEDGDVELA